MNTETNQMLRTIDLEARIKELEEDRDTAVECWKHERAYSLELEEKIENINEDLEDLKEENKRLEGKVKEAYFEAYNELGDNHKLIPTLQKEWQKWAEKNNVKL